MFTALFVSVGELAIAADAKRAGTSEARAVLLGGAVVAGACFGTIGSRPLMEWIIANPPMIAKSTTQSQTLLFGFIP